MKIKPVPLVLNDGTTIYITAVLCEHTESVDICVTDKHGDSVDDGIIAEITKDGFRRMHSMGDDIGLPLNSVGQLKRIKHD